MTVTELQDTLTQLVSLLYSNKEFATPETLLFLDRAVEKFEGNLALQALVAGFMSVNSGVVSGVIESVKKALDAERKLIAPDVTENFVRVAQSLHDHSLACRLIAPWVK